MTKWLRRLLKSALVLTVVLFVNIMSFVVSGLGNFVSGLAERLFQRSWVATELADTRKELDAEKKRRVELERENGDLKNRNKRLDDDLVETKRRNADLDLEKRKLTGRVDELNKTIRSNADAVADAKIVRSQFDDIGERIARRTYIGAVRNLGSIPLEAAPFVGALTVVAVTVLEISDACMTLEEMEKLREMAGFPPLENWSSKACRSLPIPGMSTDLADLSIEQCYEEADKLDEVSEDAGDEIRKICDCVMVSPGREAACFPTEVVIAEE